MITNKIHPRVITYSIRAENNAEARECPWANYVFDCDSGRLSIHSEAGNYSYGWGYNVHEDFMHLMTRINGSYLLDKLSSRYFDLEESKKEMIQYLRKEAIPCGLVCSGKELSKTINKIKKIGACGFVGEENYYNQIVSIIPKIDFEEIIIEKEYPRGAEVSAKMFVDYIQPQIKAEIEKEKAQSIER